MYMCTWHEETYPGNSLLGLGQDWGVLEQLSPGNMESSFVMWTYDKDNTLVVEESQGQMLPGHRLVDRTGLSTESNSTRQKRCDSYCGPEACLPLPRLLTSQQKASIKNGRCYPKSKYLQLVLSGFARHMGQSSQHPSILVWFPL